LKEFIELKILDAIRKLLTEKVNAKLNEWQFLIPMFEFSNYKCNSAIVPVISLSTCEQTEKERIIKIDAYSMSISISLPDNSESEMYCYAYSTAFEKVLIKDVTLGGIVDIALITGKKVVPPKKPDCGQEWELVISLRITVEGMKI